MKYTVVRTDTADEQIRKIILYINENFGSEIALQKLDELEESILHLGDKSRYWNYPQIWNLKAARI